MPIYLTPERIAVFWSKTDQGGGIDACWPFIGGLQSGGYGMFHCSGQGQYLTHRIAWTLTNGPIPDGLSVLHKCDNRPCCNPDHLFLGTDADNVADMEAKGRAHKRGSVGEANAAARLTEGNVITIRAERAQGIQSAILAERFGVSPSMIRKIVRRDAWQHI